MRLGRYFKSPNESKRYQIDYSNWLDSDEYVSSITFQTISVNTGTLVVVADTIGANSKVASFFVSGGNAGQTYEVAAQMSSTGNQLKEDVVVYVVRAP